MSISDPRKEEIVAGRSINLALSRRGRESLKKAGIEAQVWLLIYLWIFKSCNSKNSCLGIILGRNFCRQRLSCFLYFWLKLSKVYSAKLCKMWNSWKCISTKFPKIYNLQNLIPTFSVPRCEIREFSFLQIMLFSQSTKVYSCEIFDFGWFTKVYSKNFAFCQLGKASSHKSFSLKVELPKFLKTDLNKQTDRI